MSCNKDLLALLKEKRVRLEEEKRRGGGRAMLFHVASLVPAAAEPSLCVILMSTSHYAKRSPTERSFQKCCFNSARRGIKAPRRRKM